MGLNDLLACKFENMLPPVWKHAYDFHCCVDASYTNILTPRTPFIECLVYEKRKFADYFCLWIIDYLASPTYHLV